MPEGQRSILILAMVAVFLAAGLLAPGPAGAGDLDPAAPPGPTMKTLDELYKMTVRLKNSANTNRCMKLGYRFCDQGDGTVLDADTGLVWLKNAGCGSLGHRNWDAAMWVASQLEDGECGLSDGSQAGDWRLPTKAEWEALIDTTYAPPAVTNALGTGPWSQGNAFDWVTGGITLRWSSTTNPDNSSEVWRVRIDTGSMGWGSKAYGDGRLWPVRDPY